MIGKVVSVKMKNTVVVEVERTIVHPIYKKRLKRTSRFQVADDLGTKVGDTVRFEETRPISKTKHHRIVEIVDSNKLATQEKTK